MACATSDSAKKEWKQMLDEIENYCKGHHQVLGDKK